MQTLPTTCIAAMDAAGETGELVFGRREPPRTVEPIAMTTAIPAQEMAQAGLGVPWQRVASAPPDDLRLTLLMAPYHLNLMVGRDRMQLLAFGRDVWAAAKRCVSPTVRTRRIAEANAAFAVGAEGKEVQHGTATTSAAGKTTAPVTSEGRDSVTNAPHSKTAARATKEQP